MILGLVYKVYDDDFIELNGFAIEKVVIWRILWYLYVKVRISLGK